MHGHFSRVRFDPNDRFSAVVALQGRVSVEADANEHTAILQHYLRTLVTDLIGPHAWPIADPGFWIDRSIDGGKINDVSISAGRCYIDGMLVENPDVPGTATTFYNQPDAYFDHETQPIPDDLPFFVYLEVWERLITCVEDPEIRDVALGAGGPDSSARAKVVWQVRVGEGLTGGGVPKTADTARTYWKKNVEPALLGEDLGTLIVGVQPGKDDELCALSPDAGYRGLENQLYRVEIHSGGTLGDNGTAALPTFVWSRDNGSVVFPIVRRADQVVTVTSFGRGDDRYALDLGDWVELVDDASVMNRQPAALRQVTHIDPLALQVMLDAVPPDATGSKPELHPLLRRWDQQPTSRQLGADNAIQVGATAFALEDGIEATFGAGSFRTGDFWVFPARVETGQIEWLPRVARPPDGIRRSYVPLAYIKGIGDGDLFDLRTPAFNPLKG
jgi:hypothetical protein